MENKIIAFAGKGGVGKTSLAALTVKVLMDEYPKAKILAIDADPAVGLSTALGIEVHQTLNDVREGFIEELQNGEKASAVELLNDAHYELTDSIVDADRFAFLAIGRPEGAGCYCKVNDLLKEIISSLASDFDFVVIDGEAGIEQINRRVMEKVTHLILVSDASRKGLDVINTIYDVADGLGMYNRAGAIVNRIKSTEIEKMIDTGNVELVGLIHEEDALAMLDIKGSSLLNLPSSSTTVTQLRNALIKIGVI